MAELRMTPQRRVLLELLRNQRWHPTADELLQAVRRRLPRVSLGTVYRNLELLVEAGEICRLDSPAGPRRFDGFVDQHSHVRCVRCGELEDLDFNGSPLWKIPADFSEIGRTTESGFVVTGYRVEFEGICPRCASERCVNAEGPGEGGRGGGRG